MVVVNQIGKDKLAEYAAIPISFQVESIIHIHPVKEGLKGFRFIKKNVTSYTKWGYEEIELEPTSWHRKYLIDEWGIFIAYDDEKPVGGIAIGQDAPGGLVSPFENDNMAVIWDIRVHPEYRRKDIGNLLFRTGSEWAESMGFKRLKLETSNVNLAMFNFCIKQGCELVALHRYGYEMSPTASNEAMLVWYYDLKR